MWLDSLFAWVSMAGYGFYVWSSFIAFLMICIPLWLVPYRRFKKHMASR